MFEWLLVFTLLLLVILLFIKYSKLKGEVEQRAREIFEKWRAEELNVLRNEYERKAYERARVLLQQWKDVEERRIRENAIKKSISTILGRVGEHLAPLIIFSNYGIKPKDFRHLGTPVDFIAFKGLSNGKPEEIIFIEVKSGSSTKLSDIERKVKELIEAGKVKWMLIHLPKEIEKLLKTKEIAERIQREESMGKGKSA